MACTCSCSSSSSSEEYQNIMNGILAVEDMRHIDDLISYIQHSLNIKERNISKTADVPSSSNLENTAKTDGVASSINKAGVLLNKVLKRCRTHLSKKEFKRKLDRETRKLIIDVAKQGANIKWVGVALAVVAFALDRVEQVDSNTEECLKMLKYMCDLARHIKQSDKHLPQEKLNRVLQFVVQGSALCISQIGSRSFSSRCLGAPVMAEDLQKLRSDLGLQYSDLSLEALEAIRTVLDSIPVRLPPSQGPAPEAVGTEEASKHVTRLLDMESKSVIAVVIYGQGGIGKTTLATTVFNKLDLKNHKFCRVDMQHNCTVEDIKKLQQQILRDLFHRNIDLRSWNEGLEQLSEEFKKAPLPLFIFVDNALRESDFEKLLPFEREQASLPAQSRILVTTRNLNESQIIKQAGIQRCDYKVPILPPEKSHKLLCKFALGSVQSSFDPTIDNAGLLKICGGVPLVLRLAGAEIRGHSDSVTECTETVEDLKSSLVEGEESDLSERMVDFVFKRLSESCKEAFFDIVCFFCNWSRRKVAYVVGERELEELERAALVNISDKGRLNIGDEGRVSVHDIVQARGKRLSHETRITDEQSMEDVVQLQSEERIKKIKGISYVDQLEARHVNLMRRCLRVINYTRIVNGECKGGFEKLKFLRVKADCYSLMDVSKHPRLAVLMVHGDGKTLSGVASPSALKYIKLVEATSPNLSTTPFSQLQSLRVLKLWECRGLDSLPESIGKLTALEKLDLRNCNSLVSLPQSFGNLCSLRYLRLKSCTKLSALPESFGNLASLELLILGDCWSLLNLPHNFGQLKRLKYLCICGCWKLQRLSADFEGLSSLIVINASDCDKLEGETIEKVAKMKGVMMVEIDGSRLLEERWEQVGDQYSLAVRGLHGYMSSLFLAMRGYYMDYREYMGRALLQSGSRFVNADENGEYHEECCPPLRRGVEFCVLLTVCDLTLAGNRRYMEQVKKKWEEVGGEKMKVFVDVGVLWEERERRVREMLPLLPRGSRGWIAGDSRARLLFAHSLFMLARKDRDTEYDHPTVIACTRTEVGGRMIVEDSTTIMPEDCTPHFVDAHIFDQLFSPFSQADAFIRKTQVCLKPFRKLKLTNL